MKELVIVSGKGGTGKTCISAALSLLAPRKVMVDCDVDAANLHLVCDAVIKKSFEFKAGFEPVVDQDACVRCGLCTAHCRFEAIMDGEIIEPLQCEGCGVCSFVCPAQAITLREKQAGYWFIADTRLGQLIYAELGMAIENSGKLVSRVRQAAKELAAANELPLMITDGPPGIGCPAIAALSGANLALAVVEPSLSGMHDLRRVVDLAAYFGIPVAVCINKSTLHRENTRAIIAWCRQAEIPVVGQIPYSDAFRTAVLNGTTVLETADDRLKKQLTLLWENSMRLLDISEE